MNLRLRICWAAAAAARIGCLAAVVLLARVIGVPELCAETNRAQKIVTLEECIRTALLQNRALQIERLNPEIARATLSSSYGYYDPIFTMDARNENATDSGGFDPADFSRDAIYEAESDILKAGVIGFLPTGLSYSLAGDYANSFGTRNGLTFDSYKVFAGITVRQPLLRNAWIDQGRFTIKINKQNLKITELGVYYVALDVINRVQQAYYEFVQTHEHLTVQENLLRSRQQLLNATHRRLQEGLATLPDEQLAQSQAATAEATTGSARTTLVLAENELRTQLGDAFTNQVHIRFVPAHRLLLVPKPFSLSDSWQRGLERRPDLAQLRREVEKAEINVKFRRNQLFPSLDLVAAYGRKGASVSQMAPPLRAKASASEAFGQVSDSTAPSDMIGILFSLPIGRVAERANYRAGKELKAQAELLLKQREEWIMREISDAFHTAQITLERARAAQRAVEFAQATLEAEERRLAGGTSTLFFVLQYQTELVNAQASEIRARADYNKAVSQLGFAEASLLETHGFTLDIQ
jgi:outer membrane protein TolC